MNIPECPAPVAALLNRLPAYPGSLLLTGALNLGLAPQLPADVGERLLGKRMRIAVRDMRIEFDFTWNGRRFTPLARQSATDLTITATSPDFVKLGRRQEDPDTLFFSRRLSMEGDTELGLIVKNTLDALELPVLDLTRFKSTRGRHSPWQ
ncbi:MAG: SCP2 sterol-binding domain-containing protein [Burkholderiales bacterium]|nr:SCP2 sterol-binding domain-containing protein [Burkholderiales bacterium]